MHINRFIDLIKMAESKNLKQVTLSTREAKDLHGEITKILLAAQTLSSAPAEEVTEVEIAGKDF